MVDPRKNLKVTACLKVSRDGGPIVEITPVSGTVTAKALQNGLGDYVLDVDVPRMWQGKDLLPRRVGDLLSCVGTRAQLVHEISQGGDTETYSSPLFRLDSWEDGGDAVRLSGRGATACISEHKLAAPIQMAPSASCLMGIRAVFAPDGIVPDSERGIGADRVPFEWMVGVDRGKALEDVLSAGRMVVRETEYGVIVRAAPVLAGVDDLTLVDGEAGTVVSAPSKFERSKRPNHIVVRGNSERDGEFSAEAVEKYGDYQPAVYGWVTEEVSGDAVAGPTQALLVAQAELEKRARYSETVQVECVTDWRIKLDQTVSVTRGGVTRRGIVTGVEMPISGIGTMKLEIGVG